MFWPVLAAQLVAAQPIDPENWFSSLPWDRLVSQKGGHALNLVRIVVAPDGKPDDCQIEVTSGIPELDRETCSTIMRRGRFKPARSADHREAYGVYRKDLVWAYQSAFQYSRPVDIEIQVSRLPKGIHAPVGFSMTFAVDAAGTKTTCEPGVNMDPTLAFIACKQITENYPVIPARTATGASVPSIQNALVTFVTR